jgi:hypothetical protein
MDPEEEGILKEFVDKRVLKGTFFMDVGFGTDDYMGVVDVVFVEGLEPDIEPRILPSRWWKALLDVMREKMKKVILIEVKEELNYEAIGQIIVYRHVFPKVWGFPVLGSAIVCRVSNKTLEGVCSLNGIHVFKV